MCLVKACSVSGSCSRDRGESTGKEGETGKERKENGREVNVLGVAGGPALPHLPLSQGQVPSSTLGLVPGLNPASDSPKEQCLISIVSFIQDTLSTSIPQKPYEVYHHLQAGQPKLRQIT